MIRMAEGTPVDVKKLVRLKHTLKAAADGVPEGQEAFSGAGYADTYNRLRSEVRSSLPEVLRAEFDGLFGELESARPKDASRDVLRQAAAASDARLRLRSMVGWLEGVIESEGGTHSSG